MGDRIGIWGPATGAIATSFASLLCCAGPLLAVSLGVSGAGLAATFTPLRPLFLALTAGCLILGFWLLDREERRACSPGVPCASPVVRRRMKRALWTATVLSVLFATYPRWQSLVL